MFQREGSWLRMQFVMFVVAENMHANKTYRYNTWIGWAGLFQIGNLWFCLKIWQITINRWRLVSENMRGTSLLSHRRGNEHVITCFIFVFMFSLIINTEFAFIANKITTRIEKAAKHVRYRFKEFLRSTINVGWSVEHMSREKTN